MNRANKICCKNGKCKMPDAPWHGTYGGYTNHRCVCNACREASSRYTFSKYHGMPPKVVIQIQDIDRERANDEFPAEIYAINRHDYTVRAGFSGPLMSGDYVYIGPDISNLFKYTIAFRDDSYIELTSMLEKMSQEWVRQIEWVNKDDETVS